MSLYKIIPWSGRFALFIDGQFIKAFESKEAAHYYVEDLRRKHA